MTSRPSLQTMNFPRVLNWINLKNTQQYQFLIMIRAGVVGYFVDVDSSNHMGCHLWCVSTQFI